MPGKEMVVIGCRIPNGLILRLEGHKGEFLLAGPKIVIADGRKLGPNFTTTVVDADFWGAWKKAYADSPILASQAIFEAKSESDAAAKGKELQKEKTGFEQTSQEALGVEKSVSTD